MNSVPPTKQFFFRSSKMNDCLENVVNWLQSLNWRAYSFYFISCFILVVDIAGGKEAEDV